MADREEEVEFGGWLVTVLALLALLALSGCEKKPTDPPQPRSGIVYAMPSSADGH